MSRKPKNHYLAKILGVFFWDKKTQKTKQNKTKINIFKSKKFIKKSRKHSVDTCI